MLFRDYETYAQLFQALPIEAATAKTLLPLLRAYRRMDVSHQPFVRAACERVVTGEIELQPAELTELVKLLGECKIKIPKVFDFAMEALDLRFAYFSEDGDAVGLGGTQFGAPGCTTYSGLRRSGQKCMNIAMAC